MWNATGVDLIYFKSNFYKHKNKVFKEDKYKYFMTLSAQFFFRSTL